MHDNVFSLNSLFSILLAIEFARRSLLFSANLAWNFTAASRFFVYIRIKNSTNKVNNDSANITNKQESFVIFHSNIYIASSCNDNDTRYNHYDSQNRQEFGLRNIHIIIAQNLPLEPHNLHAK